MYDLTYARLYQGYQANCIKSDTIHEQMFEKT